MQLTGDKFTVGGILFRFAVDMTGVYNGDEFAMKVASEVFTFNSIDYYNSNVKI